MKTPFNIVLINSFLDNDPLVKRYSEDQIDLLRDIMIDATNRLKDDFITIELVGYCSGEFAFLKPFDESLNNLNQKLKTYFIAKGISEEKK